MPKPTDAPRVVKGVVRRLEEIAMAEVNVHAPNGEVLCEALKEVAEALEAIQVQLDSQRAACNDRASANNT